ncbi:thioredoxin [soil metagenome]
MSQNRPFIIEATPESFERDVLERSRDVLVVVDFWAAWCQPCRLLAPILEKLATEYEGQFVLVKSDTEALPEIAAGFGVQSIPAVFAIRDGRIVDHFAGVLPEATIRTWLDRWLPTPADQAVSEGRKLEAGDPQAAEVCYRAALERDPNRPEALIGLARVALSQGRVEEARESIAALERRGFLEPEAETLKAELILKEQGQESGGLESARAEVASRPDDLEARYHLAEALASAGQHAEALEICLELVEHDRQGIGESARKTMLALFQVLPPDSPLVTEYRRQLSFVL